MSDVITIFTIAIGAALGALTRYHLTELTKSKLGSKFPYGTLIINLTGCLAMGFFVTISQDIINYPPQLDLLIRTGFLSSYTTFSTFGYDSLTLWRSKQSLATGLYLVGTPFLGLGLLIFGGKFAQFLIN